MLFICLGNACRSPMAESIARRDAADVIEACSAGLTPLGFVPVLTMQTLAANGYSIEPVFHAYYAGGVGCRGHGDKHEWRT